MTELQRKKADWLNRAFYIERVVRKRLEEYSSKIKKIERLLRFKIPPKETLESLEADKRDINQKIRELSEVRGEIINVISGVDNEEFQAILTLKFLNYQTHEQIADILDVDMRTEQREYLKALDKVNMRNLTVKIFL